MAILSTKFGMIVGGFNHEVKTAPPITHESTRQLYGLLSALEHFAQLIPDEDELKVAAEQKHRPKQLDY